MSKSQGTVAIPIPKKAVVKKKGVVRPLEGGFRVENAGSAFAPDQEDRPKGDDVAFAVGDSAPPPDVPLEEIAWKEAAKLPLTEQLPFNLAVGVSVTINAVIIGIEKEVTDPDAEVADRLLWYMFEMLFALMFGTEMAIRMGVKNSNFFSDIWNLLDLVIVLCAIADLILTHTSAGGVLRLFTMLRTLRLIKLVRLVRSWEYFKELWLLVGGLVTSVKALGWVSLIILTVVYVCAIVCTTEVGQNDDVYDQGPSYDGLVWNYKDYFGNIPKSMFTLFQVMTLDGWSDDIVRHVAFRQPLMAVLLVFFVIGTAFGLLNVVVGVIVENTLAAAQIIDARAEEQKGQQKEQAIQSMAALLEFSDTKRSGLLSREEFQVVAQSAAVKNNLATMGLEVDEVNELLGLLDYEKAGRVELSRFIASLRELIGGARRRDIVQVEVTVGALAQRLDGLDKRFSDIDDEVMHLSRLADDFVQTTVKVLTGFDGSTVKT